MNGGQSGECFEERHDHKEQNSRYICCCEPNLLRIGNNTSEGRGTNVNGGKKVERARGFGAVGQGT